MSLLLVNVVGYNASGKTTLAKKLADEFHLNRVSGDDFRNFIYSHIHYFDNTKSDYPNERYSQLAPLTEAYRSMLTKILLEQNQSVIFDGSGATKRHRKKLFDQNKKIKKLKKVIIYAEIGESELKRRLETRDKSETSGRWQKMHHDIRSKTFEPPTPDECDELIIYKQTNYEVVSAKLRRLLD